MNTLFISTLFVALVAYLFLLFMERRIDLVHEIRILKINNIHEKNIHLIHSGEKTLPYNLGNFNKQIWQFTKWKYEDFYPKEVDNA